MVNAEGLLGFRSLMPEYQKALRRAGFRQCPQSEAWLDGFRAGAATSFLPAWLGSEAPELKGFSASNLWRMKQFYETYAVVPELATLLRELSWSKHLLILSL
jgi:hypothetical protein